MHHIDTPLLKFRDCEQSKEIEEIVVLGHPWKWMVSCMAGELPLLVWKKGTWAARVGNIEDGVLDGRKVGPLSAQVPLFQTKRSNFPAIQDTIFYIYNSCCPGPLLPNQEGQFSCHTRYHPLPRVAQYHYFLYFLALLTISTFQQGCVNMVHLGYFRTYQPSTYITLTWNPATSSSSLT